MISVRGGGVVSDIVHIVHGVFSALLRLLTWRLYKGWMVNDAFENHTTAFVKTAGPGHGEDSIKDGEEGEELVVIWIVRGRRYLCVRGCRGLYKCRAT